MDPDTEMTPDRLENITQEEAEPVVVKTHRLSSIMPIVIFSYIGLLVRLGLAFLSNNRTPLNGAFWTNFVGCLIMGFIVEQKIHIQNHFSQLYIGLATGLCGSITTFSGLMYNSCVALFGPSSHYGYPVSNYLSVITSAFASSYMGFVIGRHLSIFFLSELSKKKTNNIRYLYKDLVLWLFPILIIFSIIMLVLLAVLVSTGQYTYFIYSLIFAPFGSLTRYLLSILFNTNPKFPFGTLLANILGSYLYLGMAAINGYVHISSSLTQQIVTSVIQGYCGCLTTVSTFVLELDTMGKRRYIYIYFLATVLPVQIVYIILGSVFSSLCSPAS